MPHSAALPAARGRHALFAVPVCEWEQYGAKFLQAHAPASSTEVLCTACGRVEGTGCAPRTGVVISRPEVQDTSMCRDSGSHGCGSPRARGRVRIPACHSTQM